MWKMTKILTIDSHCWSWIYVYQLTLNHLVMYTCQGCSAVATTCIALVGTSWGSSPHFCILKQAWQVQDHLQPTNKPDSCDPRMCAPDRSSFHQDMGFKLSTKLQDPLGRPCILLMPIMKATFFLDVHSLVFFSLYETHPLSGKVVDRVLLRSGCLEANSSRNDSDLICDCDGSHMPEVWRHEWSLNLQVLLI